MNELSDGPWQLAQVLHQVLLLHLEQVLVVLYHHQATPFTIRPHKTNRPHEAPLSLNSTCTIALWSSRSMHASVWRAYRVHEWLVPEAAHVHTEHLGRLHHLQYHPTTHQQD